METSLQNLTTNPAHIKVPALLQGPFPVEAGPSEVGPIPLVGRLFAEAFRGVGGQGDRRAEGRPRAGQGGGHGLEGGDQCAEEAARSDGEGEGNHVSRM